MEKLQSKTIVLKILEKDSVSLMYEQIQNLYPNTENLELIYWKRIMPRELIVLQTNQLKDLWKLIIKLDKSKSHKVANYIRKKNDIKEIRILNNDIVWYVHNKTLCSQ